MDLTDPRQPDEKADVSLTNGRPAFSSALRSGQTEEFMLAGWRVRPLQNRLSSNAGEIVLEPKAMDVLVRLAVAGGETVSREDLLSSVWPDVFVTDDSLHRAVSRLRRALSAHPELSDVVITVPKRGYRLHAGLLAPVNAEGADSPAGAPKETPAADRGWKPAGIAAVILGALALIGGAAFIVRPAAIADLSGLRAAPFTGFPGQERAADFAPDGERAVFVWSGEDGEKWDLYVKSVDEWTPRRLTTHPDPEFNPAWSPDGEIIAFVRIGRAEGCRIMLMPAAGGEEEFLRACSGGADVDLSWSPDSEQLFFTDRVGADGPLAAYRLDMATRQATQVTFPPSDYWGDNFVRVSPDGQEIAVARTRALGVTDVYAAPADGNGDVRQITDDRLKIHGLGWSPDGEQLYFSSNRGGTFGLWRVGKTGGRPQPVTGGGVNADSVTVARNGERLLYETESAATRMWRVSLAEFGPPNAFTQASGWDWHPALSPDAERLAFVSDRSGSPELWVSQVSGASPRRLTDFGGSYTLSPAWSPDGSAILAASPVDGNFDIYEVDSETGAVERLTDHPAADRNPAWSKDGKAIYFGSNRTGRWEIWRLDRQTRAIEQITTDGGFRAQIADNGEMFYVKRETAGLYAMTPDAGGRARLIADQLLPLDWANWAVVGPDIIFIARDDNIAAQIMRLNIETGQSAVIRPLADFPYYSGLAVSPDGSSAVFTRTKIIESDLMMLEGFAGW